MRDLTEQSEQQTLFAIFNGTSENSALAQFYELGGSDALPLWLNTPYAEWHAVMPYMAQISKDSDFVAWVENSADLDWGMFVLSEHSFETVYQHIQSLTQVWLAPNQHVFFRFYDPRFSIEVAKFCNEKQREQLMGPCSVWFSRGYRVENPNPNAERIRSEFPWWNVPESVTAKMDKTRQQVSIQNSMKWLKEQRADLYFAMPEPTLNAKVTRIIQQMPAQQRESHELTKSLATRLSKEVYR